MLRSLNRLQIVEYIIFPLAWKINRWLTRFRARNNKRVDRWSLIAVLHNPEMNSRQSTIPTYRSTRIRIKLTQIVEILSETRMKRVANISCKEDTFNFDPIRILLRGKFIQIPRQFPSWTKVFPFSLFDNSIKFAFSNRLSCK